jgi:pimeloyl-ACP methyl ester carboxylesterase
LIVPDLPGFGGSEITVDDDIPWAKMAAQEVLTLLETLGVDRAHILGNSAGGSVAIHMALAKPQLAASLLLMGCAGLRVPLFSPAEMSGARLLRTYRPNPTFEKMRAIVEAFVYDPSKIDVDKIARERFEITSRPGASQGAERIGRNYPKSLAVTTDDLSKIAAPTLLIWGRDDRFVGVDDALVFLATIPDARLCLLAKCGHWLQHEKPADFIAQVRGFVTMNEKSKQHA